MDNSLTRFVAAAGLAAAAALSPLTAQAQGQLQWRSTTCEAYQDNKFLETAPCQAGFAYDTAVRAIKVRSGDGRWLYFEVGSDGVSFGGYRECLSVEYNDGISQQFCTVKTVTQLGILGD